MTALFPFLEGYGCVLANQQVNLYGIAFLITGDTVFIGVFLGKVIIVY